MARYKIGIALSGGGARGVAHIGVLQALESAGIYPEIVSGCSAGAMVGALYCAGFSPHKIYALIENKSIYSIIKMGLPNKGMMELSYFRKILQDNIQPDDFGRLKKPLFISVTNLNTGKAEIIGSGKLIDYVIASQSIPLVFKPQQIHGNMYVDGGVMNNLPVEPIRDQCDLLIGVNVTPVASTDALHGMRDVGYRVLNLSLMVNMDTRLAQCDVVIEPDTARYTIFDLNKSKDIYAEGYESTLKQIDQIKQKLDTIHKQAT
ncbi:MAG: patatin-like phospholipase family protein [Chitinophagales bacterium]